MNALGLDMVSLAVLITAVLAAGTIRGYSGFGFAMVAVTGMAFVLPPIQVVPVVLILEVLASLQLIPQIWRHIDWFSLRWLLAGSLVATPLGVYVLATIPEAPMRVGISLLILLASVLLLRGWAWKQMPGGFMTTATGIACGLLNGAAAIGGPPVIIFYLSSPAGVSVSRASIIAYFLGIDSLSLAMASIQGLTTTATLFISCVCLPPLLAGIAIGNRLFGKLDQESFRRYVLLLLIILSIAGLLRAALV